MTWEIEFRRTYVGVATVEADTPEQAMAMFREHREWEDEWERYEEHLEPIGEPTEGGDEH